MPNGTPPALQSPEAEVPSLRLNTSDDYDSETWIRTKFWKFWKIEIDYISVIWTKNSWYLTGVEELQGLKVFMGANFVYAFSFLVTSNTCTSQPRDVDLTTCRNNKKQKQLEMQQGGFFEIPVPGFLRRISRPQGSCEIPRSREYQGILGILGRPASLWKMSVKLLQNLSVFVYINREISEIFFWNKSPSPDVWRANFPPPKSPGNVKAETGMGNDSSLVASMGGTKNLGHSLAS